MNNKIPEPNISTMIYVKTIIKFLDGDFGGKTLYPDVEVLKKRIQENIANFIIMKEERDLITKQYGELRAKTKNHPQETDIAKANSDTLREYIGTLEDKRDEEKAEYIRLCKLKDAIIEGLKGDNRQLNLKVHQGDWPHGKASPADPMGPLPEYNELLRDRNSLREKVIKITDELGGALFVVEETQAQLKSQQMSENEVIKELRATLERRTKHYSTHNSHYLWKIRNQRKQLKNFETIAKRLGEKRVECKKKDKLITELQIKKTELSLDRDMWKNQAESLQKGSTFKKEYDSKWQRAYREEQEYNNRLLEDNAHLENEVTALKTKLENPK